MPLVSAARFHEIVTEREADLLASRDDPVRTADARQELYRVYRKRQGMLDAIAAYERRRGVRQDTSPW